MSGSRNLALADPEPRLAEGVRGLTFHEAEIVEVVKNASLARRIPPRYYWARAQGLIEYDYERIRSGGGAVPVRITDAEETDFFHFLPDKGSSRWPAGYACTFRVLEICRRHRIGNLNIYPIDFNPAWPGHDSFQPDFQIALFGEAWPPQWYPEGFTPRPSNQMAVDAPSSPVPPPAFEAEEPPVELERARHTIDWTASQPIDGREVDPADPADCRVLSMNAANVERLERELHLTVPPFLRRWFLQNPFSGDETDTCALICHADRLIKENVELRRKGHWDRKWPESLLYIGHDQCGGVYFVETAQTEPAVHHFHPEGGRDDVVLPEECEPYSAEDFLKFFKE